MVISNQNHNYMQTDLEQTSIEQIQDEYNLAVSGNTKSEAKAKILEWKEKYGGLKIAGLDDRDGYKAVTSAIAELRTTRTTIENKRKDLKALPLEIGRKIDATAKELIGMIEPMEEALKAEKKIIDDEKERLRAEKEAEAQKRIDDRVMNLTELMFTFNGTGYQLGELMVSSGEVKNLNDEQWNSFVSGPATKAFELAKQLQEEEERKEAREKAARELAERTAKRKLALIELGFTQNGDSYSRENQSAKKREKFHEVTVFGSALSEESDEHFNQLLQDAKEDIIEAQRELRDAQRKQEEEKQRLEEERRRLEEEKERAQQEKLNGRKSFLLSLGLQWDGSNYTKQHELLNGEGIGMDVSQVVLDLSDTEWEAKTSELTKDNSQYETDKSADMQKRAELEAQERAEKEEREKKEMERLAAEEAARIEALKPDKERMEALATALEDFILPTVQGEEFKPVLVTTKNALLALADTIRQSINKI